MAEEKEIIADKKEKGKNKKLVIIIAVVVIIIAVITAAVVFVRSLYSTQLGTGDPSATVEAVIPEGSDVDTIASILEESGAVDSAFHFRFLCKINDEGKDFKYGRYVFSGNADFSEITEKLNTGRSEDDSIHVTVREGMWLREIAQAVAGTGLCSIQEFLEAADSRDYDYDFIDDIPERDNLLEGYLYPETYYIPEDADAHTIVDMMLRQFDKECSENDIYKKAEDSGKSLDDIVIIASLIESEVKQESERPLVSSVIHNRLDDGIKLQIDASVIYSLGERVTRVFYSDLERQEEHNTYYVDGLPIGPICSPRAASLVAAAEPADTDYLYYVVEDQEAGSHYFTADYDDFLAARERYVSSRE